MCCGFSAGLAPGVVVVVSAGQVQPKGVLVAVIVYRDIGGLCLFRPLLGVADTALPAAANARVRAQQDGATLCASVSGSFGHQLAVVDQSIS